MGTSAGLSMMVANLASAQAQAGAIEAQGQFEKQQAEHNARIAEMQAKEIEERGVKESNEFRRKVRGKIGAQRAALAAQGVDIGVGTAVDLQQETFELGEMDAEQIKENAYREAFGLKQGAINTRLQGRVTKNAAKFQARNTLLTGGLQAASSGLDVYSNLNKGPTNKQLVAEADAFAFSQPRTRADYNRKVRK